MDASARPRATSHARISDRTIDISFETHRGAAVSMHKLGYLLRRMEARGTPARTILAGTGLRIADLNDPDCRPSVTQYRAVLRRIMELSPPGIGIAMGLESTIADEGVLGYAA